RWYDVGDDLGCLLVATSRRDVARPGSIRPDVAERGIPVRLRPVATTHIDIDSDGVLHGRDVTHLPGEVREAPVGWHVRQDDLWCPGSFDHFRPAPVVGDRPSFEHVLHAGPETAHVIPGTPARALRPFMGRFPELAEGIEVHVLNRIGARPRD